MLHQHQAGEETLVALCPDIDPDVLHPETGPDAPPTTYDALRSLAHALASLLAENEDAEEGRYTFTLVFDVNDGRVEAVSLAPDQDEEDLEEEADPEDEEADPEDGEADEADEEDAQDEEDEEDAENEEDASSLSAEDEAYVSDHADRFAAAIARQFDVDEEALAARAFDLAAEAIADDEA